MWGRSKQATSATMALVYLTVGALTDVWTVVYYMYLSQHGGSDTAYLWCHGFLATGIVLIVIGLLVGRVGRSAKQAETAATPAQVITTAPAPAPVMNAVPQQPAVVAATAPMTAASVPMPAAMRWDILRSSRRRRPVSSAPLSGPIYYNS